LKAFVIENIAQNLVHPSLDDLRKRSRKTTRPITIQAAAAIHLSPI
jgi:hypothetical protein